MYIYISMGHILQVTSFYISKTNSSIITRESFKTPVVPHNLISSDTNYITYFEHSGLQRKNQFAPNTTYLRNINKYISGVHYFFPDILYIHFYPLLSYLKNELHDKPCLCYRRWQHYPSNSISHSSPTSLHRRMHQLSMYIFKLCINCLYAYF